MFLAFFIQITVVFAAVEPHSLLSPNGQVSIGMERQLFPQETLSDNISCLSGVVSSLELARDNLNKVANNMAADVLYGILKTVNANLAAIVRDSMRVYRLVKESYGPLCTIVNDAYTLAQDVCIWIYNTYQNVRNYLLGTEDMKGYIAPLKEKVNFALETTKADLSKMKELEARLYGSWCPQCSIM